MREFYREKLKSFIIYTIICGILFAGSFLIGKFLQPEIPFGVLYYWGTFCVFGSMWFGVVLPIILRLLFHNKAIKNKKVSFSEYKQQQTLQTRCTFIGTIFICPACLFPIPAVHLYVTVLAVLYAIYSVIPSKKKLIGEINLYKIKVEKDLI